MKFASITTASALAFMTASAVAAELPTRFGKLTTNDENVLLMNGKRVKPEVQGNNSLSFVALVPSNDSDIVILASNGGNACPLLVRILTISATGIKVSPEFGSCSDLVTYAIKDEEITIFTPRMQGKGNDVFKYSNGVVTQYNRPVK